MAFRKLSEALEKKDCYIVLYILLLENFNSREFRYKDIENWKIAINDEFLLDIFAKEKSIENCEIRECAR